MAKSKSTAPAGASSQVHPNDHTDARTQDAARVPSEFDELQHRLLGVLQHLRLVDQRLYDFQTVPPTLQAAGVVLHDATAALDGLYDEFDAWHVRHVRAPEWWRLPNDQGQSPSAETIALHEAVERLSPAERSIVREELNRMRSHRGER